MHVDRPSFGLLRRAPTEPTAVDQDDLVLIGQRTLLWERFEPQPKLPWTKSAGTPSPKTSM